MNKDAIKYLDQLSETEVNKLAYIALKRLIQIEEVLFRTYDPFFQDDKDIKECFYWDSCGKDLLDDR